MFTMCTYSPILIVLQPYPFGEHRFQGLHRPSHGTALVAAASVEAVGAGFADAWAEKGGEPVQRTGK